VVVSGSFRIFVSTAPAEVAPKLARALVDEKLAACVNVLPGARSVYSWKGETCDDAESVLLIKTTAECAADLARRLVELHPYEVPELVAIELLGGEGNPEYLAWLAGACSSGPGSRV
jgi:periplasmic divalent cation tolerance protein